MPSLLGVTNPVPGQDTTNINRQLPVNPSSDTRVQNAPNLDRVSRPDNRTERQDSGDAAGPGGSLRYDSNFQAFLQKLRDTPGLAQTLARLMAEYKSIVSSGMDEGIAAEMGQLLSMLPMDESELLKFLTQQLGDSARFRGPLFTMLREAYSQSQTQNIKPDILQFLKRYGDFTSCVPSASWAAQSPPATAAPLLPLPSSCNPSSKAATAPVRSSCCKAVSSTTSLAIPRQHTIWAFPAH